MKQLGEPAAEVVSAQRWLLTLPVTGAVGEDVWCACIVCGLPRQPPIDGKMGYVWEGLPVEFLVRKRNQGTTMWSGLHKSCWQQSVSGVPDYIGALDAANKLIGEAADEAKKLTDERDQLAAKCAAYEEKFALQREVVDIAVTMTAGELTGETADTCLFVAVGQMMRAAKERGDGTV